MLIELGIQVVIHGLSKPGIFFEATGWALREGEAKTVRKSHWEVDTRHRIGWLQHKPYAILRSHHNGKDIEFSVPSGLS